MEITKRKNKIIFILIATVVLCTTLAISVSAENGYAPGDLYLTGIGEYRGVGDYTTYGIVNGYSFVDQNGNTAYEISSISFNQTFFDRYVDGYSSIDNIMTMYFSQNQSFSIAYYHYDNGTINEVYWDYDVQNIPFAEYWDNYVDTFRLSLEQQFGGWFNDINSLNNTVNSLQSQNSQLIESNGRLINENLGLERENQSYIGQISELNNNIASLNNQIESLENQLPVEYNNGYENGYLVGYDNGMAEADMLGIGLNSIFSAPSYALYSIFNFEIFGINVLSILLMVISIVLIAWLIKKFV